LKQFGRGLLAANIAVLFFGMAGVLGKLSTLPSPLIVFGRVFFASPVLLVLCLFQRLPLRPRRMRDGLLLPGLGILLAVHWSTFFQSIAVSNVATGLLSFSSFPLFTAALEPLLLHQRPSRSHVVASLLILPGIYLLVPSFTLQNQTTLGVFWGVLSGATFALLSVANRGLLQYPPTDRNKEVSSISPSSTVQQSPAYQKKSKTTSASTSGEGYPSLVISLYQDGVATIALLPALLLIPEASSIWAPHELLILLFLGVVCTALAHTLFIASLRSLTAQSASLVASLEPVWGIVFGIVLLQELPTVRTLLGGVLIIGAVLLPAMLAFVTPHPANKA
jgi:drug/metabolite transporter (DMT)-like permease